MSRFKIDLTKTEQQSASKPTQFLAEHIKQEKPGIFTKILKIIGVLILLFAVFGAIGGFFYWQYLKSTPQYSLALLVDSARQNDEQKVDELVDTDAVVEDFLPQITDKAIELYGRNLPPEVLKKVARVATPLMPAVKERARAELPNLIRQKTQKFEDIPFWAIAVGAGKYLDIQQDGGKAFVNSKLQDRPLEIEMRKNGNLWQVVAVKDEILAQQIAERIGKEIMELAKKKGEDNLKDAGRELGVENIKNLFEDFSEIFNQ
jgi:hypothetical protein